MTSSQKPEDFEPRQTANAHAAYALKLTEMTDDAFVGEVQRKVWLSAFASNNPRAPAHWQCDATWDESRRRAKPWLYQRGWNEAYLSCGYEPTETEMAAARAPLGNAETEAAPLSAAEDPMLRPPSYVSKATADAIRGSVPVQPDAPSALAVSAESATPHGSTRGPIPNTQSSKGGHQ